MDMPGLARTECRNRVVHAPGSCNTLSTPWRNTPASGLRSGEESRIEQYEPSPGTALQVARASETGSRIGRTRNRGDGAMWAHRGAVRKKRQRGSPASCAIRGKRRIQAIPPRGAIATETWSTPTVPASREHQCPPRQGSTNRQDDPTGSAQAGSGNDYELG